MHLFAHCVDRKAQQKLFHGSHFVMDVSRAFMKLIFSVKQFLNCLYDFRALFSKENKWLFLNIGKNILNLGHFFK